MNRELKFRVWLHDSKQWGDVVGLEVFNTTGKLEYLYQNQSITIQQYTGMKDRNGVEVYEGDIVLYRKQNREVCIGEFWDGADDRIGTFLQNPEIKHRNFGTNKLSAFTSCEIIGNIFENPELLK